jgi:hypothetical protein
MECIAWDYTGISQSSLESRVAWSIASSQAKDKKKSKKSHFLAEWESAAVLGFFKWMVMVNNQP